MRKASAPRLAVCGESVRVDRNSAIAATPSIEKVMNAIATRGAPGDLPRREQRSRTR